MVTVAARALVAGVLGPAATATAQRGAGGTYAAVPRGPASAFPPEANSAWAYDTSALGTWVDAIKSYNQQAKPGTS